VPVVDLSDLLVDEDFADSNHPNPTGQAKLFRELSELAVARLREMGTLDASPATRREGGS
jgi:hypothetical protein